MKKKTSIFTKLLLHILKQILYYILIDIFKNTFKYIIQFVYMYNEAWKLMGWNTTKKVHMQTGKKFT